jgi:hydroxymethylpyrimidine pyrophosphatase-like HAD family hydrolase
MIQLVLCDVDGTLATNGGAVSDRVIIAVRCAVADGIEVGFATGRTVATLRPIVRTLGLPNAWAICDTGAVVARLDDGRPNGVDVVHRMVFDPTNAVGTILVAAPGARVSAWHGETNLATRPFRRGHDERERVAPLADVLAQPITCVDMSWPDRDAAWVGARMRSLTLPDDVMAMVSKNVPWVTLLPAAASKATGTAYLAARLGLDASEIMAIGDDYNDIDLLSWAGRGVAMGNAPRAVVAAADEVTDDVAHDGAAVVLEALVAERRGW